MLLILVSKLVNYSKTLPADTKATNDSVHSGHSGVAMVQQTTINAVLDVFFVFFLNMIQYPTIAIKVATQ